MSEEFVPGEQVAITCNIGSETELMEGVVEKPGRNIYGERVVTIWAFDRGYAYEPTRTTVKQSQVKKLLKENKEMNELESYKKKVAAVLTSLFEEEAVSSEGVDEIAKQLDLTDMSITRNYYVRIEYNFRYDSAAPLTKEDVKRMMVLPFKDGRGEPDVYLERLGD